MAVQIQVRPRFQDVMELNRWAWNQRIKGYVAVGGGIIIALISVVMWWVQDEGPGPLPGVLAGGMFVLIGLIATRVAGAGAWLFQRAWRPYLVEVGPEGVAVTPDGKERVAAGWDAFKPYYETPNLLVLPIRNVDDAVSIPKRCCSQEQLTELRQLLTGRGTPTPTAN
jgi:hypothetical protein